MDLWKARASPDCSVINRLRPGHILRNHCYTIMLREPLCEQGRRHLWTSTLATPWLAAPTLPGRANRVGGPAPPSTHGVYCNHSQNFCGIPIKIGPEIPDIYLQSFRLVYTVCPCRRNHLSRNRYANCGRRSMARGPEDWRRDGLLRAVERARTQWVRPAWGMIGRTRTAVVISWDDAQLLIGATLEFLALPKKRKKPRG